MNYEYKKEYPNSRVLIFDIKFIPEKFHGLSQLYDRWALTDAADLCDEIDTAERKDLEKVSFEVGKLYGEVSDWLADPQVSSRFVSGVERRGSNRFSDTYEVLTALLNACDLADTRLEQEFGI
ncbi:hypothetical protein Q0M94_01665 [Deinococcus radiomollis]|uniref:hypothetical protein n=1 Tax=Deinococcus radiomollis TaxID=468916 RepID=UPI0038923F93